jgi:SWI/SNF-related matrix-associated actin-dependent regulator of chromatin subfamily A3
VTGQHYSLSITIKIFADVNKRSTLLPLLRWTDIEPRLYETTGSRSSSSQSTSHHQRGAYGAVTGNPGNPYAATSQPHGVMHAQPHMAYPYALPPPPMSQVNPAEREALIEKARKTQEAFAKAAELRDILNNLEKVNDEGRRGSLLDSLCSTEDVLSLPAHSSPPSKATGELTVDLLKHQV